MFKSILFWKVFALLGLIILMMIPVGQLMDVVWERSNYRQNVVEQVSESTSRAQRVFGPLIVIPYTLREEKKDSKGEVEIQVTRHHRYVLPETLVVDGKPQVEIRKLGIYQTQVYQGPLQFQVTFGQPDLDDLQHKNITIGQPFLLVSLSDSRGIKSISALNSAQQSSAFEPGTQISGLSQGIHAPLALDSLLQNGLTADFTLTLAGTRSLSVVPLGRNSELLLQSNWPHPNFLGNFLPDERTITDSGFTARWRSTWFANNINSAFLYDDSLSNNKSLPTFNTSLIEMVDHYQMTGRAVKYAVLFLGLTFMAFFLFETLTGLRVHPIQYLLVGAALVLFYLILLAFSEHLGFDVAYLLASVACSGLIGLYLSAVLHGKLRGMLFAGSLLLLYGVLYMLLQSEDNALLLGSGLLFAVLAGIMLLTRKLDWYQVGEAALMKSRTPGSETDGEVTNNGEKRFRLWK